jgi:adenylate cyclase
MLDHNVRPSGNALRPPGRGRLPITSTLLVGFAGLVAVALITVMFISIRAAQENTNQLQEQTGRQSLDAAIARVDRYLSPAADNVTFIAGQLSREHGMPLDDDARIETLLRGSLAAAPQIESIVFVRADLTIIRVQRGVDRYAVTGSIANEPYSGETIEAAKHVETVAWNDVYYVPELNFSYLSVMAPIRHYVDFIRDGEFKGVILAMVPVGNLSRLIESGDTGSTIFIVGANDRVIAHPYLAHGGFYPSIAHFQLRRMEVPDPVLQALWSAEAGGEGGEALFGAASQRTVHVEAAGQTYIVLLQLVRQFSSWPSRRPWIVGISFPAEQLSGPIVRLRYAFVACVTILAIAVGLALLLGQSLARPIRRLAESAAAVSAFDFSGARRPGGSPLRELDAVGQAWDSMLQALRWFETYVPKALVGQLLRQSAQADLTPEEREVTVMFTDIVAFSRSTAGRAPKSVAAFLNRHFRLIGQHVQASDGTIDKYIGDSVMAFWGAPTPDPDHAEHAARAALALAETLAADNRRRAAKGLARIRIRIGLHSGPVIVGNVGAPGRVNYTLVGDTVNAAQSLEQLGKSFDDGVSDCIILASAAVVARLPTKIARRPLGDQTLKGMGIFEVYQLGLGQDS